MTCLWMIRVKIEAVILLATTLTTMTFVMSTTSETTTTSETMMTTCDSQPVFKPTAVSLHWMVIMGGGGMRRKNQATNDSTNDSVYLIPQILQYKFYNILSQLKTVNDIFLG